MKLAPPFRIDASFVPKLAVVFYSDFRCYKSLVYFLSGLPIFTNVPPSLATPVERTNFQVVCQAEGFPRPVINWSRLRMPLPAGRTEVNQGTLIIKNLIPADSGLYECIAANTMGTKKATINVAVQQLKLGMCACVFLLLLLFLFFSGAPNESIVQNHLNIALMNPVLVYKR